MQKNRWLSYARLLQLFSCTTRHDFRDIKTEYIVRLTKQFTCAAAALDDLFGHSGELCALAGKNVRLQSVFVLETVNESQSWME